MIFNNDREVIICGTGYQTESILEYFRVNNVKVISILTDVFTKRPEKCFLIPSKRLPIRNSFSEVDMMMDSFINGIAVKRYDMLSVQDKCALFIYYEQLESINAFYTINKDDSVDAYMLSESELEEINNSVWDNNHIINELWKVNEYLYSEVENLKNCMRRQLKSTVYDFHFELHLVEHCNLKCAGCTHFSSIANEEYADLGEFSRDINRLSELTGGVTRFINLLGGEPLLHPQICDFMEIARKAFPKTTIRIVTNGIRLLDMEDDFWESCRENKIIIGVTKYPISIDYDKRIEKILSECVEYECFSGDNQPRDEMWRLCLDETGSSRPLENFIKCPRANACIFVKHGKVYNCATMANIDHFNKCFETNIELCEADCVDIYKCKDIDKVLEKLCNPKPFCRYCNIDGRHYGDKWRPSCGDRNEW